MKLKTKIVLAAVAIVVVGAGFFLSRLYQNGQRQFYTVIGGDFVEIAEVSGRVIPGQEIDLSFGVSGKISSIRARTGDTVNRGDVLATLDLAEIESEISESLANLQSAKAKLSEISGDDDLLQNQLDSINTSLVSTLKKSYITADDVVRNSVDTFIADPDTRTPEFDVALSNYFLRKEIENQRFVVKNNLDNLMVHVFDLTPTNVSITDAGVTIDSLHEVEKLLALISSGTDDFEENSNKSQSQIDAYISGISQARTAVAGLVVDINNATENVRDVLAEVPILRASINSSTATVNRLNAKKENYIITAPFGGVVTDDFVEVGQVVGIGEVVFSMISNQALQIESFVPEVNIAGVEVGDDANLVFDAFDEGDITRAFVSHVDPRETIKDGITTYRILLDLYEFDTSILSGMSVEIEIIKDMIPNKIVVPRYLIQTSTVGKNFVEVTRNGDDTIEKLDVKLGRRDGSGNVIIEEGLSVGDKVVVPE